MIVVNAEKIAVTGNKRQEKRYYRHSGYPGGLRSAHARGDARAPARGGHPPRRQGDAARATGSARQQLRKLKVYAGPEHPHEAQKPEPMEIDA